MNFICMSKDFRDGSVELHGLQADDENEAWEQVEEEIAGNVSQDWLFSEKEWEAFVEKIKVWDSI